MSEPICENCEKTFVPYVETICDKCLNESEMERSLLLRKVIIERDQLRADAEKLVEALQWYADNMPWCDDFGNNTEYAKRAIAEFKSRWGKDSPASSDLEAED